MSGAVVTGSRVYGTPREDSDVDVVILADLETQSKLRELLEGHAAAEPAKSRPSDGLSIRVGRLNLIATDSAEKLEAWRQGTRDLEMVAPVTRDVAVAHFRSLFGEGGPSPLAERHHGMSGVVLEEEKARGFLYVESAVEAAFEAADRSLGATVYEDEEGLRIQHYKDGSVLAFARSPRIPTLWRDVSRQTAATIRAERSEPLDQPAPAAVKRLASIANAGGDPHVTVALNSAPGEPPRKLCPSCEGRAPCSASGPCGGHRWVYDLPEPPPVIAEPEEPETAETLQSKFDAALGCTEAEVEERKIEREERRAIKRGPTIWDQLAAGRKVVPPVGAMCASCAYGFEGVDHVQQHGTHFAHPWCVEREQSQQVEGDGARGPMQRPECLELARGAVARPFKAKALKGGDKPCQLCLRPIRAGELQRRKSSTSGKRMHDACVLLVLEEHRGETNNQQRKGA